MSTTLDPATNVTAQENHPLDSAIIGVLVHNEEATIEACLRAILAEEDGPARVRSVLVVASGCTDRTEEIVRNIANEDSRVRLIAEPLRSGKVAAINVLLSESSEPIVVTVGGDMVLTRGSLVKLLEPFEDPAIGMTGVRPIPTNPRAGIIGNVVNILWDIHHELSIQKPKLGETVAFRRVIRGFDIGTVFDEATMEHLILSSGMRLRYVPEATVRNRGPENLREFLEHRTRNNRGHLALASATGYRVATMNTRASVRAAWRVWRRGEKAHYIMLAAALEAIARMRAKLSPLDGRPENALWHPITTSKRVVANGHRLRAHHDGFQRILIRPMSPNGVPVKSARSAVPEVRRIVRVDDQVRLKQGQVALAVRSDADGARALSSRIQATLPHLHASHLIIPVRGPDETKTPAATIG